MAHIERTDHPVMSAYVPPADPAPFTLGAFLDAYYEACRKAWDEPEAAPQRAEPSITLPEGLWPDLARVVNPLTRSLTPVQRVPMFSWGNGTSADPYACICGTETMAQCPAHPFGHQPAVNFIAKGHLGTPCPRPRDGGMCGCDEDDDAPPKVCLSRECDC